MPESVKSCGSRLSTSSRSKSTTSLSTNWSTCYNFTEKYEYACKLHHTQPLREIKGHLSRNNLSFIGDRIKYDDWIPLIKSISGDKFLHYIGIRSRFSPDCVMLDKINCERKVREFTKGPVIFTRYVLLKLIQALSDCLVQSRSLMCLQLQKLPLQGEPLQILSSGLEVTKSLQHLSLQSCNIGDYTCELLCRTIRNTASLLSLDLSNNNLSEKAAESVAELLKTQEIARYGECWKHSLRYRDVPNEMIPGLRRISLNNNPDIGDQGLSHITEVLFDDYWVKAIDMQNCGITDQGCNLVINLLNINNGMVIFDVRQNSIVDTTLVANVVQILAINSTEEEKALYGWLDVQTVSAQSGADSSSSTNSIRTKSALNLRSRANSQNSRSSGESLIKSFSMPSVQKNPKIIPKRMPILTSSMNLEIRRKPSINDIMKDIGKFNTIKRQIDPAKPKSVKEGNTPMKVVSYMAVTECSKSKTMDKKCIKRSTSNADIPSKNILPDKLSIKYNKTKDDKNGIENKKEEHTTEKHCTIVKVEACSTMKTSQTYMVDVPNGVTQHINKNMVINSKEKLETINSSDSTDSDMELCIKQRQRHIQHTFSKFMKSQENPLDDSSSEISEIDQSFFMDKKKNVEK